MDEVVRSSLFRIYDYIDTHPWPQQFDQRGVRIDLYPYRYALYHLDKISRRIVGRKQGEFRTRRTGKSPDGATERAVRESIYRDIYFLAEPQRLHLRLLEICSDIDAVAVHDGKQGLSCL